MQLNEQYIIDDQGKKQAVIIPFRNYQRVLDIIRQHESVWQTDKGSAQSMQAFLQDEQHPQSMGNAAHIERHVQSVQDAWGDE